LQLKFSRFSRFNPRQPFGFFGAAADLMRLQDVKLLAAGIDRVGERRGKDIDCPAA
jgi:hypothetical protein